MSKFVVFISILLISLNLFIVKSVNASTLYSKNIENIIKNDVTNQISTIAKGKITTEIVDMPFNSLSIPNGNLKIVTDVNLNYFSSFTIARVKLLVNGQIVKRFGVPVKIHIYDSVLVAITDINNGDDLTFNNVVPEYKDIASMTSNVVRSSFNIDNKKTNRAYRAGDIIDKRFIIEKPSVVRNSLVSIYFQDDNFTLTLTGKALDNGKIGDFIRVRNYDYKKDYTAEIIGVNKVLVNL